MYGERQVENAQKNGKLKVFRDAFRKTKAKEILSPGDIDSVICWHAKSPEHTRKFLFAAKPGWMWVYVETPYIKAYIYSKKGTASTPTAVYRSGNDADGSAVRGQPISCKNKATEDSGMSAVHTDGPRTHSANA